MSTMRDLKDTTIIQLKSINSVEFPYRSVSYRSLTLLSDNFPVSCLMVYYLNSSLTRIFFFSSLSTTFDDEVTLICV